MSDRAQLAGGDAAGFLITLAVLAAVDTLLAPGLWARSTVHACVYALNHAEKGAETTFSVAKRPIDAEAWRPRDDVQASLMCALALGWFATPFVSLPATPWLAAVVIAQALPLALDPVAALAEVRADD